MKTNKSELLLEILSSPFITAKIADNKIILTGATKDDSIVLKESDASLVAKFLKHENKKVTYEAIKLMRYFNEKTDPYLVDIVRSFTNYSENEQKEILRTFTSVHTVNSLKELGKLLERDFSYDILLEVVFSIDFFMIDYPLLAISSLLNGSKNETIWRLLIDYFRNALAKAKQPYDPKERLEDMIKMPPPIGISQEAERAKSMLNVFEDSLETALRKILELKRNGTKSEQKEVNKLLKELNHLI
ncbi:MAG: hypothetical protein FK734_16305 [Asgard group archaeon]|nr:hypothetical protein [Asgard group archaeon]